MHSRLRVKAPASVFRLVRGAQAVLDGRSVRLVAICSSSEIQVRVDGTGEIVWARAEQLLPPTPTQPPRILMHPHDSAPELEAEARRWSDVLAELPLRPTTEQRAAVANRMAVHPRTVSRRHALFLSTQTPASQLKAVPGPPPGARRLSPAAEAIIDRVIEEVYLTRQRCPITAVYARIRQLCSSASLKVPSYKTVRQRIRSIDPMRAAAKRLGASRAEAEQAPSLDGITTSRALEMVQIDHALVDLIVVSPDTRLPIGRPWITVAIDVHTRCVIGYYLGMEVPRQTSVALCLAHACLPKLEWMRRIGVDLEYPMFGKLESVSWDNAKTFRAHGIDAQCERYGIRVHRRPVKKPRYGAYIERYIGTFMGKIHLLPGTTFSNTKQRGDYDSEKHAVMTLQELATWIGHEIVGVYHHTKHRGLGGLTPYAKWKTSWTRPDGTVQIPPMIGDPRNFLIGLLPRAQRSITREGISLSGLRYWDPAISQLINDGQRHLVHFHQGDLSKVYLYLKGDYIDVPLLDRSRPPFTIYELREAKRALANVGQAYAKEEIVFNTMDRQRQLQDAAAATSKRARRKQALRAAKPTPSEPTEEVDYSAPLKPINFEEAEAL